MCTGSAQLNENAIAELQVVVEKFVRSCGKASSKPVLAWLEDRSVSDPSVRSNICTASAYEVRQLSHLLAE